MLLLLSLAVSVPQFQAPAELPALAAASVPGAPVPDSVSMFPQDGSSSLLGYAKTQSEADEAAAHWAGLLRSAGLTPGAPSFDARLGMYTIPYSSPDGRVLRRFAGDPRSFAPKDPAALTADKNKAVAAAQAAGLRVVSAPEARIEGLLPSYYVYYLTARGARREDETQLRLLERGDAIDFALLEKAGVKIVSRPKDWLMVYLGPQLSFVSFFAPNEPRAREKLAARIEELTARGLRMIGSRIGEDPENPPEYRWYAQLYFYL